MVTRLQCPIKALNVAYTATRSVTSERSQCWKLKFSSTTFKTFMSQKNYAVYFVEICTVDVK